MKIAVMSDIHENFHNLAIFFEEIKKHNIEKILFLWDFINNGIAKILAASPVSIYAIRGNNDGDKVAITKTALSQWSNLEIWFDTFDTIEIDKRKIFLTHYPMLAKPMAKSGDFDAVFYGHDHKVNTDQINNCIIINPWEISAHKTNKATFAIYDTTTNQAEIITLDQIVSVKTKEADNHREQSWIKFSQSKSHQY